MILPCTWSYATHAMSEGVTVTNLQAFSTGPIKDPLNTIDIYFRKFYYWKCSKEQGFLKIFGTSGESGEWVCRTVFQLGNRGSSTLSQAWQELRRRQQFRTISTPPHAGAGRSKACRGQMSSLQIQGKGKGCKEHWMTYPNLLGVKEARSMNSGHFEVIPFLHVFCRLTSTQTGTPLSLYIFSLQTNNLD